jgi:hypothetical protein
MLAGAHLYWGGFAIPGQINCDFGAVHASWSDTAVALVSRRIALQWPVWDRQSDRSCIVDHGVVVKWPNVSPPTVRG